MPHLLISFQDWQSCLKEKDTPLEGFEPQSKVRIQARCDMHRNHQTIPTFHNLKLDICLICNWWQAKRLSFVRFPGKQGRFSKNVYTICWSMWSEVPMQS